MATFDVGIIITAVNNAKGTFNSIGKDLEKTEKRGKKAAKSLRAIQVVLASIAIGAGIQFSKTIIKVVGDMELLIARLGQVEGGLEAARFTLKKISDEFAATPFAIDAVANGFTRLRAAGLSTDDAFDVIRGGVDAVAAFGGSTTELNRLIIGMQQAIGKGTLSMEEMRQQIGEAVPAAMRVLAREMDISIGELFTRIENGSVDAKEAVLLMSKGFTKDFGGFAKTLGTKILGSIQSATSKIRIALEEAFNINTNAGRQVVDLIKKMEKAVIDFIDAFSQSDVDAFFTSLKTGGQVVLDVVQAIRAFAFVLIDVANGIATLLTQSVIFTAAGGLIGFLLFGPLGAVAGTIIGAITSIFGVLDKETSGAQSTAQAIISNFGASAAFGFIGWKLFGKAGPAAIVAAIATIIQKIGQITSTFEGDRNLIKNLDREIAIVVGKGGSKAGITFVKNFIKAIEGRGIGQKVKEFILPAIGVQTQEMLIKLKKTLSELEAGTSSLGKTLGKQADAATKKMATLTNLISRTFAKMSVSLRKLVSQAETTTFGFGSQAGEKLRRQLLPMIKQAEMLREKINDFVKKAGSAGLNKDDVKTLADARRNLKSFEKDIVKVNAAIASGEAKGIADFADKVSDAFTKARLAVNKFGKSLLGDDGLGGKLQGVRDQFEQIKLKIDEVIEKQKKLGNVEAIAKSNALLQQALQIREKRIAQLRKEHGLQTELFVLQQKSTRLAISGDIARLAREQQGGLQSVFKSAFGEQADDRKLSLKQGILTATEKIKALEIEALGSSDERAEEIARTTDKLRQFIGAQQEALKSTSASAILAKSAWEEVGNAITETTKGALKDLVRGTFDAERVILAFYDKLVDAAINYLIELVKIQIRQQLIKAAAGAGGGGAGAASAAFASILTAAASGAVVSGGVKTFASGDIIRGPTMFGLAGEAGDEAIMPLTRIGGQLGVRATGGGGDNYHISIRAIDAQSSIEFIRKNSRAFVSTMKQQGRLNNGIGSSR